MSKQEEPVVMPVCPYCKATMQKFHFKGYYDEFYHWECEYETLPDAKKTYGGYA